MSDVPFACRSTLNCYVTSRTYERGPTDLYEAAVRAVQDLSGLTIGRAVAVERDDATRWLSADFRILFFTDDFDVQVEAQGRCSVIHVRSMSRTGRSDLGTNRRRVDAFFECLDD